MMKTDTWCAEIRHSLEYEMLRNVTFFSLVLCVGAHFGTCSDSYPPKQKAKLGKNPTNKQNYSQTLLPHTF